ncbi:MAG: hypothetical protein Q3988_02790 [Gemella sp.]|nr:hypothetical protein [Gemella sp.]
MKKKSWIKVISNLVVLGASVYYLFVKNDYVLAVVLLFLLATLWEDKK